MPWAQSSETEIIEAAGTLPASTPGPHTGPAVSIGQVPVMIPISQCVHDAIRVSQRNNIIMKILIICMIAISQTFCETVNIIELRRSSPDSFSLTIQFENETEVYNLSRKKSSHLMTLIADEDESLTSLQENDHVSLGKIGNAEKDAS